MNVTPVEPAPPGFENETNKLPEIQKALDAYKGNALIGLEYTIELHENERHEPGYLCILCDKRGDPRSIMQHWTSFNHRLKYLEKHYPSAMRECQPIKYKPNSQTIMTLILQALAEAIEDHHGRLVLTVMNADEFRRKKTQYTEEINNKYHFSERNGPSFLNAVDRTLFDMKCNKRKELNSTINASKKVNNEAAKDFCKTNRNELDEISSDSDHGDKVPKKSKVYEQEAAYRILPRVRRSPPFEEERDKKKLPTPKELSLQASHIAQERYKWEKYRCMWEIQLKQMEKIQENYEKSPEKHPSYPQEWEKFWNRRYKELHAEKKVDPNKYDYKPEWIVYWTERMKELYTAEVEKKKKEIKLKVGLSEDAEEKVDQLKEKYKVPMTRAPKNSKEKTPSEDVIDISDDDSPKTSHHIRKRSTRTRSRSRSHSRSLSPFSDDYELTNKHYNPMRHRPSIGSRLYPSHLHEPNSATNDDYYNYSRSRMHGRYPSSSSHYPPTQPHYRVFDSHKIPKYEETNAANLAKDNKRSIDDKEDEPEGPLTVVAVLRLLTALEDHLGSLGPKVVDLLGKALALEKVKANSSDDLLLNEDHCVFFETIKEKLKGLLIADVLDDQHKVRAVKKAIKNIAAIIHQVTVKGPESAIKNCNETDRQDVKGNGGGNVNGKLQTSDNNSNNNINKNSINNNNNNRNDIKFLSKVNIKDLPFDRQVIATKMAASLVMQGREDVSTVEMDKLIYLFILMVKLSKTKREVDGESLYVKHILPQLGLATSPSTTSTLTTNNNPVTATISDSISANVALSALPAIVDELFEKEITSLVQEVEEDINNDLVDKDSKNDTNSGMLESLTDSDLQTLLQNFKHLSSEEQHHLIAHLKKLESADPARVEKLRKFVNFEDMMQEPDTSESPRPKDESSSSSMRKRSFDCNETPPSTSKKDRITAPGTEEDERHRVNPNKFSLDDDDEDDDYNFEEVFKAASNNINVSGGRVSEEHSRHSNKSADSKSSRTTQDHTVPEDSSPSDLTFNPDGLNTSLNDTQNLIANLMGSLQQSNSTSKTTSNTNNNQKTSTLPEPVPPVCTQSIQPPLVSSTLPTRGVMNNVNVNNVNVNDAHNGGGASTVNMMPPNMSNISYYQAPQPQHPPDFGMAAYHNQMQPPQVGGGYYNMMPGTTPGVYNHHNPYNAPGTAGVSYSQWGNGPMPNNMQQYGVQNYGIPPHHQQMGYNMYGPGGT